MSFCTQNSGVGHSISLRKKPEPAPIRSPFFSFLSYILSLSLSLSLSLGDHSVCITMRSVQELLICPWSGQTMAFLLLLFLWGSTQVTYVAEGRVISSKLARGEDEQEKMMLMKRMRSLIGSSPPMCERKCSSCGHCEAVQVPFVPQQVHGPRGVRSADSHIASASTTATTAYYSRGDDISNYKPMTWKCRCGDMFFSP